MGEGGIGEDGVGEEVEGGGCKSGEVAAGGGGDMLMLAAGAGITLFKMNLTADSLIEKYPGECQKNYKKQNAKTKPTLPKTDVMV